MSLEQHKITSYEDNVKDLPDYPSDAGITAKSLKEIFDGRTEKEIKKKFNALIDELQTRLGEIDVEISVRLKEGDINFRKGEGEDSIVQYTSVEEKEGAQSTATGTGAFATGRWNRASADCAVALNYNNEVTGTWAFACGYGNKVSGDGGFASGAKNTASEIAATATGSDCVATGRYSFAGGHFSEAKHESSFVAGHLLKSMNAYTAAFGKFNDYSNGKNIFVVGFGANEGSRENVLALSRDGIIVIKPSYIAPAGSEATLQLGVTKLTESALIEILGLGDRLRPVEEKAEMNFAEVNNLYGLLMDKVDKVPGKGLSANDFTDDDRADLRSTYEKTAELEVTVDLHVNDKNNPHELTPAQIGAVTRKEASEIAYNTFVASDDHQGLLGDVRILQEQVEALTGEVRQLQETIGDIDTALDVILEHQEENINEEGVTNEES